MSQPPSIFAIFAQTAARAGIAALERAPVAQPPQKGKKPGCTPCAAMARRDAAAAWVPTQRVGNGGR